jgi:RNA polymerase sigma-70 factor (ECF subfamily)
MPLAVAIAPGSVRMSTVDENFDQLLAELRDGSEEAAWQLIEQYGPHIHRVVRRHLNRRMRGKFDSIDFVQSVWASFFREPEQIQEFRSPEQIIAYLAATARYKVVDETRRRLGTKKRDVMREESWSESTIEDESNASAGPTPDDVAIAREAWNQLVAGETTRHREIVRMRIAGNTYGEIAQKLDINERTARKIVDRLLQRQSA